MKCFISPELRSGRKPELRKAEKNRSYCPPGPIPGYIPSTLLVKRTSFEKVGYFDSKWRNGESVDWLFKAREAGLNFGIVDDILVKRRIHETNKSVLDAPASKSEYFKIIRESLDRRRKQ